MKQYEPIISSLMRTEYVDGIDTSFDRTDREEIEARLLENAVLRARSQAESMAKGSGQRIVKLRAISQHEFENVADAFGLGDKDIYHGMASVSPTPVTELLFVPATVEFQNEVSVIYEGAEKAGEDNS